MVLLLGLSPLSFGASAIPAYIIYNKLVLILKNDSGLYCSIDNSILYVCKRVGPLLVLVGIERLILQIMFFFR
jgi:hypothetical protein